VYDAPEPEAEIESTDTAPSGTVTLKAAAVSADPPESVTEAEKTTAIFVPDPSSLADQEAENVTLDAGRLRSGIDFFTWYHDPVCVVIIIAQNHTVPSPGAGASHDATTLVLDCEPMCVMPPLQNICAWIEFVVSAVASSSGSELLYDA
jgi:hypothetical protein